MNLLLVQSTRTTLIKTKTTILWKNGFLAGNFLDTQNFFDRSLCVVVKALS